jgi:hypothetical protein
MKVDAERAYRPSVVRFCFTSEMTPVSRRRKTFKTFKNWIRHVLVVCRNANVFFKVWNTLSGGTKSPKTETFLAV